MKNVYSTLSVELPEPFRGRILEFANGLIDEDCVVHMEKIPHITIKWGIDTIDVNKVAEILGKFIPIRIMFGATKMFMADDHRPTDVVKIDVFGMSLKRIREKIEKGLETYCTYKYYNPHCTLAYVDEHAAMQYVGSNPVIGEKVVVDRVVFSPAYGEKKYITCDGEILDYANV